MTSRRDGSATECFVYITLPGQTDQVVAGRVELKPTRSGPLARFVYGRTYLERQNAVVIDPVELDRLSDAPYARPNDLFYAIRDAAPDAWGRQLIDRALGGEASEIGYLLESPDDGAGALAFGTGPKPPAPKRVFNRKFNLAELQQAADDVIADKPLEDPVTAKQVERLLLLGTSMGGARPKAVIEDEDALWVAKFSRPDDPYDICRLEKATLDLASECGIEVAHSRLETIGGRSALLVKRFDREKTDGGWLRHRMISALTALKAEVSDRERWSYLTLSDELRRSSKNPVSDPKELFARATFNALVNNNDDHPRNHALIADETGWRLSPAYDLVPIPMVATERNLAMRIGTNGSAATKDNLLSSPERFLLKGEEAEGIIDNMRAVVEDRWYPLCRATGMTEAECERIRSAYLNPGFDWEAARTSEFGA